MNVMMADKLALAPRNFVVTKRGKSHVMNTKIAMKGGKIAMKYGHVVAVSILERARG